VFPIAKQRGDAGDLRFMKLQLRAAVEFGPKLPGTSWSPRSVRFNYLILIADTAWQARDEAAHRCAAPCRRRRGPPNLDWRRGVASPRLSMVSRGSRRKTLLNRIAPFQGAPRRAGRRSARRVRARDCCRKVTVGKYLTPFSLSRLTGGRERCFLRSGPIAFDRLATATRGDACRGAAVMGWVPSPSAGRTGGPAGCDVTGTARYAALRGGRGAGGSGAREGVPMHTVKRRRTTIRNA
jgi:hypothetical protein